MRPAIKFAKLNLSPINLIAEVGVCMGDHAKNMYNELNPQTIYLVDIEKHCEFEHPFIFIKTDSRVASLLVPNNLDLVYIDALHTECHMVIDIACWYPKIRVGGIICGHDYSRENGVGKAVHRFFNDNEISIEDTDWWVIKKGEGY